MIDFDGDMAPNGGTIELTLLPKVFGTDEINTLVGTDNPEALDGKGGSDVIVAEGGNDIIVFDINDMAVNGGSGEDTLLFIILKPTI